MFSKTVLTNNFQNSNQTGPKFFVGSQIKLNSNSIGVFFAPINPSGTRKVLRKENRKENEEEKWKEIKFEGK